MNHLLAATRAALLIGLSSCMLACVAVTPTPAQNAPLAIGEQDPGEVDAPMPKASGKTTPESTEGNEHVAALPTSVPEEDMPQEEIAGNDKDTASAVPDGTPTDIDCFGGEMHSEAQRVAEEYNMPPEEIMGWFCAGFGFGDIQRGLRMNAETGWKLVEILPLLREGMEWEAIQIKVGASPSTLAD
jgi:hypothetical protein